MDILIQIGSACSVITVISLLYAIISTRSDKPDPLTVFFLEQKRENLKIDAFIKNEFVLKKMNSFDVGSEIMGGKIVDVTVEFVFDKPSYVYHVFRKNRIGMFLYDIKSKQFLLLRDKLIGV